MQPPSSRMIVTEKGNEFLKNTASFLRLLKIPNTKRNSPLPSIKDRPTYSILETINSNSNHFEIPSINLSKHQRTQSLYFYQNNRTLMNFHLKTLHQNNQKPTIFSSISDPFDPNKRDFHQSSISLLSTLGNRFTSPNFPSKNQLNSSQEICFSFFTPIVKKSEKYEEKKDLFTEIQRNFYTKPLVKNLREDNVIDKVQNKKLDYFNEKFRYFEDLKERILVKKESKSKNVKSKIMDDFAAQNKLIEESLVLKLNEQDRFQRRLMKYNREKFKCKNLGIKLAVKK